MTQTKKGATFVDLDGTLVKGNSLKIFMGRLPWTLLKRRAPGASILSLWWMGCRCLRLVSHRDMKWRLTRLSRRHLLPEDWDVVAERISAKINPVVKDYMDSPSRSKCAKFIATAAMEEYVAPLCRLLGYDGIVATRFSDIRKDYVEMRGLEKLAGIQDVLASRQLRLESFLTDHYDDIPTAREYPGLSILVNPSRKMQKIFHKVGVTRYL